MKNISGLIAVALVAATISLGSLATTSASAETGDVTTQVVPAPTEPSPVPSQTTAQPLGDSHWGG